MAQDRGKAAKKILRRTIVDRKARRKNREERRLELRDSFWSDAESVVWTTDKNNGWTPIPRLLPLIQAIQRHLCTVRSVKGDPSSVYFELWTRTFDDGFAVVPNENECAFASGYTGTRAVRTWQERIRTLEDLHFIRTSPSGNRQYARVLLIDPLHVCAYWRLLKKSHVPDELWNAFLARAEEIGAVIPTKDDAQIVVEGIPF